MVSVAVIVLLLNYFIVNSIHSRTVYRYMNCVAVQLIPVTSVTCLSMCLAYSGLNLYFAFVGFEACHFLVISIIVFLLEQNDETNKNRSLKGLNTWNRSICMNKTLYLDMAIFI